MTPDEIEALRRRVYAKSMACPFFLRGALLPVLTYFQGKIPWKYVKERADLGMDVWHRVNDEDRALLQESYYQELDALMALFLACKHFNPDAPGAEAALQDTLLKILQEYVGLPEVERKVFFI